MTLTICLIEGDGVGKEVIPAAAQVLGALGLPIRFISAEAGWECFTKCGDALPQASLEAIRAADAALFGATQSPMSKVEGYRSPVLTLRKLFDLYANIRPTRSLPIEGTYQGVDLLIVRENTEGLYSGRERREDDGQVAITERVITVKATERIARIAFQYAMRRPKRTVTVVHKANVIKEGDGLFREVCFRVAAEFPQVTVNEMLVDACAMWLVRDPSRFDVIVTENLFGDILSDEAAGLVGGLGVAPSANIGAGKVAYFEPVHGSAPDIAGQGIANPIGAILSAAMLLEHLGAFEKARRVECAVESALRDGVRTHDLGGTARTAEMTDAIVRRL